MVKKAIIGTALLYVKQLPAELDVKKAFLFGSCALGQESEDSDIDIAVVLGNMTDFFETQMQLMRLRRNIDLRIEPHPIGESEFNNTNPFAWEVQSTGIEIDL